MDTETKPRVRVWPAMSAEGADCDSIFSLVGGNVNS